MSGWGLGILLASLAHHGRAAERRRRRQAGRYALEIEAARARGWTETAARIEAEWREWMASEGADK